MNSLRIACTKIFSIRCPNKKRLSPTFETASFYYFSRMRIIIFYLFLFASIPSFSQKLSYRNLKGVWRQAWTIDIVHNSYMDFIDSKHVVRYNYIKGKNPVADTMIFTYTINNSSSISLIHFFNNRYTNSDYYWFIKIENGILKAQGDVDGIGIKPKKWDKNTTMMNTAPFYKIDKVGSLKEPPNHKEWIENEKRKLENRKKITTHGLTGISTEYCCQVGY